MYHAVKNNLSKNSLDCTLKLNSKLSQDAKIEAKLSCSRAKSKVLLQMLLAIRFRSSYQQSEKI